MVHNEVIQTMLERRSVRAYKAEQLSDEQLDTLLRCAISAPSARNAQPWHFTVLQDSKLIDDFAGAFREGARRSNEEWIRKLGENPDYHVFFHAPTVVLVSAKEGESGFNLGLAVQNLVLAAQSMGLASVILGLPLRAFEGDGGREILGRLKLPAGFRPFMCVSLGYPDQAPEARPRNFDVVDWIR